jgi:hypothetical protein
MLGIYLNSNANDSPSNFVQEKKNRKGRQNQKLNKFSLISVNVVESVILMDGPFYKAAEEKDSREPCSRPIFGTSKNFRW